MGNHAAIATAGPACCPPAVQAQFGYTANNGTITITGYTGRGGAVAIPDTINGLPVTCIGNYAFANQANLSSVTIPNSVTGIGYWTFAGCTSLSSVTIPSGRIIPPVSTASARRERG